MSKIWSDVRRVLRCASVSVAGPVKGKPQAPRFIAMTMAFQKCPSSDKGILMLDSGLLFSFDNPFGLLLILAEAS